MVLKIFDNSFLKNAILEFGSEALTVSIYAYSLNDDEVHNKNMISTKIVIRNFRETLQKLSFIFFTKIQMMLAKSLVTNQFWNIYVCSFKISNSDSLRINKFLY